MVSREKGEEILSFAKTKVDSLKKRSHKEDKDTNVTFIELPGRFASPGVRVRIPKWKPNADFDAVEIGKVLLQGINNRVSKDEKRVDDHNDQLITELKGKLSKEIIDDSLSLKEILEEFGSDVD